jgi:TatD DNase family protein
MLMMPNFKCIDTHAHLYGDEFKDDLPEVIARAKQAGVAKVFLPAIDLPSVAGVMKVSEDYPGFAYPMIGLQPEEVRDDWKEVLSEMRSILGKSYSSDLNGFTGGYRKTPFIAIGECGLDFYWSREFEKAQLAAFEEQVKWSVETHLPLEIHCRKAQNELLHIMKPYEKELPGGVIHCFTGNQKEAEAYLRFSNFSLGIGGVSTFKSSHLREDLPASVPLSRIVLETDSPYMAPVPHRGTRNESAYVVEVLKTLALSYGKSVEEVAAITNENVKRIFGIGIDGDPISDKSTPLPSEKA